LTSTPRRSGGGVSPLRKREFAPAAPRFENAIRRIEQIPAFFNQATLNLVRVPKPHIAVALLQVDGLSQFLEETFLAQVDAQAPALSDRARKAVDDATTAVVAFGRQLKPPKHKH